MRIKLAIFDLAGTVIDKGSCAPVFALQSVLSQFGFFYNHREIRKYMGFSKREHIKMLTGLEDERLVDQIYKAYIPIQLEYIDKRNAPLDGVMNVFEWLKKQDIKVACATGYDRIMAEVAARWIANEVEFIATPDNLPAGKPAPWMIFRCMEECDVYPPGKVVMIGDTIADIQAGTNAEVWTIGVTDTGNLSYSENAHEVFMNAGAHFIATDITGCVSLIKEIW